MRTTLFSLLSILLVFYSCDDGDIIVTDFDFDEVDLDQCILTKNNYIYLKINNDTREGLSFNFMKENFDEKTVGSFDIELTKNTQLVYRRFNTSIDRNYYCGNIPPSNILVEEEFISSSGTATISTEITNEDDLDGVDETADESLDTDGDGIPNYKDQDDDNDNVLTAAELGENGLLIDTDNDGIPNYLDPDDDGDGILTKYEDGIYDPLMDIQPNGDPRDNQTEDAIADYLNKDFPKPATLPTPEYIDFIDNKLEKTKNNIETEYTTTVIFENLILEGLDPVVVEQNLRLFGTRTQKATIISVK